VALSSVEGAGTTATRQKSGKQSSIEKKVNVGAEGKYQKVSKILGAQSVRTKLRGSVY